MPRPVLVAKQATFGISCGGSFCLCAFMPEGLLDRARADLPYLADPHCLPTPKTFFFDLMPSILVVAVSCPPEILALTALL